MLWLVESQNETVWRLKGKCVSSHHLWQSGMSFVVTEVQ